MRLTLRAMCFKEEEDREEVVTFVRGTGISSIVLFLRMRTKIGKGDWVVMHLLTIQKLDNVAF